MGISFFYHYSLSGFSYTFQCVYRGIFLFLLYTDIYIYICIDIFLHILHSVATRGWGERNEFLSGDQQLIHHYVYLLDISRHLFLLASTDGIMLTLTSFFMSNSFFSSPPCPILSFKVFFRSPVHCIFLFRSLSFSL